MVQYLLKKHPKQHRFFYHGSKCKCSKLGAKTYKTFIQTRKVNFLGRRFSIDDAFEEETDEAIKVYGATTLAINGQRKGPGDSVINIENGKGYKMVQDTSCDSDSLIQDYYDCLSEANVHRSCWNHPKVRENWRMVSAATGLFIIGTALLITGVLTLSEPNSAIQGAVFLLAGFICFIPGAYHIVYIYLAAKGRRGYHFHNLPLFT